MGGYGRPGRETGGGYCALLLLAFVALILVGGAASAQTIEERLQKARTEVNATQNAADRALYAIKKTPPDIAKATLEINATKNAASRALYAIDQALKAVQPVPPPPPPPVQCPDGSTVPAGQTCPVVTPPPPPPPPPPVQCPDGTTVPAGQTCPVPPPPVTGQIRAIQACKSSFPIGVTAPDAASLIWPVYPTLTIGGTFTPIAKGLTHDNKPLTSVSAGTFLSSCFG